MDAVLALALAPKLADVLNLEVEEAVEILTDTDSGDTFNIGRAEYVLYSDADADAACRDSILDSLAYFRPEFLDAHADIGADAIQAMQTQEDHAVIKRLLESLGVLEDVINDAISSDGRGHFLAGYDFEEIDLSSQWFIYRTN